MTTQKKQPKTTAPGKHWRKGLTLVELIRRFHGIPRMWTSSLPTRRFCIPEDLEFAESLTVPAS